MKNATILVFNLFLSLFTFSQNTDSLTVRNIYSEALLNPVGYENLRVLCKDVGNRLSGSENAEKAVQWGYNTLKGLNLDKVYLQDIMVPKWTRGDVEKASIYVDGKEIALEITTLGGSISSDGEVKAPLIVAESVEALRAMNPEDVKGKIVLLNEAMQEDIINTFQAYGNCSGKQRYRGASEVAKMGGVACMVRSLTTNSDHHPHTGSMGYLDSTNMIPAVALSTANCDWIENELRNNKLEVSIELNCKFEGYVPSHNVIGEIKGTENPDKVVVVGGHLDSWDLGEGAHDDGAGCVQAIDVLRIFKTLGIKPKHTIRCVLFMNEENGNMGGKTYAKIAKEKKEEHVFAVESDRGGFTPRGFSIDAKDFQIEAIKKFEEILAPYNLQIFERGHAGVDISPLKKNSDLTLIGYLPDSQRYFDYHHTDQDVFESVNERELQLGAASMASLIYLLDKYGIPNAVQY